MKEHLPVSRTTTSAIELHYLGVPAKTTGEGAETEFPVTSQPESKLPRHRNPAESKMSHRQGAQAQGRKGACSEWKSRGSACYISGTCYLHILPALCCRPPSAGRSGCLPANHRGRQSACFHSFHSQLLCTCSSSPPSLLFLPSPRRPPPPRGADAEPITLTQQWVQKTVMGRGPREARDSGWSVP